MLKLAKNTRILSFSNITNFIIKGRRTLRIRPQEAKRTIPPAAHLYCHAPRFPPHIDVPQSAPPLHRTLCNSTHHAFPQPIDMPKSACFATN